MDNITLKGVEGVKLKAAIGKRNNGRINRGKMDLPKSCPVLFETGIDLNPEGRYPGQQKKPVKASFFKQSNEAQ